MDIPEGRAHDFSAGHEALSEPGDRSPGSSDAARAAWRKSSWSTFNGNCVEVAVLAPGTVAVRDTKAAGRGPVLLFDAPSWGTFLSEIKNG